MSKKVLLFAAILVVLSLALCACTKGSVPAEKAPAAATEAPAATEVAAATEAPAATEAAAADATALAITGKVDAVMGWSEDEVKAMNSISVEATNKKGEKKTYTGILMSDLLTLAKPQSDATTVVFVADDGYTAEAPLADVMSCADCIVSFRDNGGFSTVMPAFDSALQVKGVLEIQVK